MTIQINLQTQDVNTILEGLAHVQANAVRLQIELRDQANAQLEAQRKAKAEEQQS